MAKAIEADLAAASAASAEVAAEEAEAADECESVRCASRYSATLMPPLEKEPEPRRFAATEGTDSTLPAEVEDPAAALQLLMLLLSSPFSCRGISLCSSACHSGFTFHASCCASDSTRRRSS